MLREGPIPRFVHGVGEYVAGILLLVAPFVFGFDSDSAIAVSIVVGVLVLVLAASTEGPTSLVNQVPLGLHVVLDYALAGLLIGIPFIFGFSGEGAPTVFFITLGVVHLMVTIGTRFQKGGSDAARDR
ncbi:MAG: SPW repeat protein [Thermoleophilaceae bacterium]